MYASYTLNNLDLKGFPTFSVNKGIFRSNASSLTIKIIFLRFIAFYKSNLQLFADYEKCYIQPRKGKF